MKFEIIASLGLVFASILCIYGAYNHLTYKYIPKPEECKWLKGTVKEAFGLSSKKFNTSNPTFTIKLQEYPGQYFSVESGYKGGYQILKARISSDQQLIGEEVALLLTHEQFDKISQGATYTVNPNVLGFELKHEVLFSIHQMLPKVRKRSHVLGGIFITLGILFALICIGILRGLWLRGELF